MQHDSWPGILLSRKVTFYLFICLIKSNYLHNIIIFLTLLSIDLILVFQPIKSSL